MQTVIENIFGVYTPITDANGIALSGMAGVNWQYIAGVLLFSIVLVSFLKLVGVLLKR